MPPSAPDDDWIACPHCGAKLPEYVNSCRHCGAEVDMEADDVCAWEADIPTGYGDDDDFDYDEFVAEEFDDRDQRSSLARGPWGWLIALIILALCFTMLWW